MEILSRASVQNTLLMRGMLLHILIILKILISEKTLDLEKLRNERGERRNGHTRTSNGTTPLLRVTRSKRFKVKELALDFYLKEHGLTTIGRELDKAKVKAIRCHYYRHIKESVNTDESC